MTFLMDIEPLVGGETLTPWWRYGGLSRQPLLHPGPKLGARG